MKYRFYCTSLFICFVSFVIGQGLPQISKWLDDQHYLESRSENGQLVSYKVNAVTGQRTPYKETSGISLPDSLKAFLWDRAADGRCLLSKQNDLYLFDGNLKALTADPTEEKVPSFSPNGQQIVYVKQGNLFIIELATLLHRQITTDGGESIYNGYASWVYFEEILGRASRYKAYWWSPDGSYLAFLYTDDRPVPTFPITRSEGVHVKLENEHYPKSGDPNPHVHLNILQLKDYSVQKIEEDAFKDQYTAWPFWSPDSKELIFQELNRDQTELKFYSYQPATRLKKFLFEEKYPTWVEFHEKLWFTRDNSFYLIHPLDGWWNIYKYDYSRAAVQKITGVTWRVNEILHIDESKNQILFTGTGENPINVNTLFSMKLDGTGLKKISTGDGSHRIQLSPGASYFIDTWSNLQTPWTMYLAATDGKKIRDLGQGSDPNKIAGIQTEYFTVPSGDGFQLPVIWTLPADIEAGKKAGKLFPVIFSIYGGPDAGGLRNSYRDHTGDPLLGQGVIRLNTDHRGSGLFGKKGLDFMHRNLGKWEIHDYSKVAEYIKKLPFIDSTRIAIEGGSYGGYITALALTKAPQHFTHGISAAPVTDWLLYDNVYTERYMDTPAENPDGYKAGSVLHFADQLKGKLLITHGSTDDNVHMQNTYQLIEKFQLLGKQFDLMIYPNVRHGGWGAARNRHNNTLESNWWAKNEFQAKKPSPKS
jgi:dipeptidyl-peptidase 4